MSKLTMLVCWAGIVGLSAMTGCSKKGHTPSPSNQASDAASSAKQGDGAESAQAESSQIGFFNDALKLWSAGQKDESVQILLDLNWNDPAIFDHEPALTLSESEFVKLSASERQVIKAKGLAISKDIRMIVRYMVQQANQHYADNQTEQAQAYKQTLEKLANTLSASDKLKLIQMVGEGAGKYAAEQIVEHKTD